MKQFNFSLFLFVLAFIFLNAENSSAQQVSKNYVVVEIATGTWCYYCPGAALGADDLVENGHQVAIIENHNADNHDYPGSNARNSYYGISGYPTAFFDGGNGVVGGSHTSSMYNSYLPEYNAAIAVMSDFTLDLSYTRTGLDFDVTIDLDEVGTYTGTNLVVHLVLTESHVAENWQGQTELDFISRAMYPNQSGTAYTGGTMTLPISFTANGAWNINNCELVAFVQDNDTKEILQADKVSLLEPVGTNNIDLMEIETADSCDGVSAVLKVNSLGTDDITSLSIDYSINSGAETDNISWSAGTLPFNEVNQILLDIPVSNLLATNTIEFDIVEVNGVNDDDTSNNTANASFGKAIEDDGGYLKVTIQTDHNGNQSTWVVNDSSGTEVASGGPYGNNQTYHQELNNLTGDCYTFIMQDTGGDGGAKFILNGTSGNLYYSLGNDYTSMTTRDVKLLNLASVDETAFSTSLIFPNPTNSILNIENADGLTVSIVDILGRELFIQKIATSNQQINVENFAEGTYIVKLTDGVKIRTEKVVISK